MKNISVIIPTYNREKTIRRSIDSVLKQDGQGEFFNIMEIIIVDDCSNDNTETAVKAIDDLRIKYIRNKKNHGAGGARNIGARFAKENWIAFHDSDDVWVPEKLKLQVQYLENHPDVEMVCGSTKTHIAGKGTAIMTIDEEHNNVKSLATRNFVAAPTIMIKRETFLNIGGFDEDLKALEDWDLGLRYAAEKKIGFINSVLIEVELLEGGVSSHPGNYFDSRCRMIVKNKDILVKHDCLQTAMERLFIMAEEAGVLKETGMILEQYLLHL